MRVRKYDMITRPIVDINEGHRFDGSGESNLTYRQPQIYLTNDGGYTTADGHPVEDIGWFYNPATDATYKRFRDTITGDLGHSYEESDAATVVGKAPSTMEQADRYVRNYGLEQLMRDSQVLPTDNTWFAGYGKEQNPQLKYQGLTGAMARAAWEKRHPYLSAAGYVAGAAPFAVAAYPLMATAGEVGAPLLANPYVDTFFSALGGADAFNDIYHGRANATTALETTPMFRVAKPIYNAAKEVPNAIYTLYNNGTIWDKYTTLGGRFGNYSDNPFVNAYATMARRFDLPDKPRIPADAVRKLAFEPGEIININNGTVDFTGTKQFLGNPHVNVTLDRPVVSHKIFGWDGNDAYLFPMRDFLGQMSSTSLKSTEPSDVFSNGVRIVENPQKVTLISGDREALKAAKKAGMQTLSSPKLRRMYDQEAAPYLSGSMLAKSPKHKQYWLDYATEVQRLQAQRGTPTLSDYRLLEQQTGLKGSVAPMSKYYRAINELNKMIHANINDIYSGAVKQYVYPNGRVVDWDKAQKELDLIKRAKYNGIFYDPASYVEHNWQVDNGIASQ